MMRVFRLLAFLALLSQLSSGLSTAASATPAQEQQVSSIAPRRPAVPEIGGQQFSNPIDAFVASYFQRHGMPFPRPVPDAVFARRVYLDLWGLLPTPDELAEFLRDARPDKRERLIDQLFSHKKNYSEHWISFWNDLLRNDEGVYYHGTRESISGWLLKALEDNLPYDQFVTALLNPTREDDPKGFLLGVNWRGTVSASQKPAMQAAQNSAQVFLGVNLKCSSCHDSFIDRWKLRDSYGMAALFSEEKLELARCEVSLGELAEPKFLFPELGDIPSGLTAAERKALAARLFTMPENGRVARTLVNRIWKKLFGRGMVEPVDDMDSASWDAELLDWLASDFVDHGYDTKWLLRRMMTSLAYQLPADVRSPEAGQRFVFRGPLLRRLTAEQFVDAVSSITGEWRILQPRKAEAGTYSRDWRLKSTSVTRALGRPIRDQVFTDRTSQATTLQALELVNGEELAYLLQRGAGRVLRQLKPSPANLFDSGVVSSGRAFVDIAVSAADQLWLVTEDVDSYDRARVVAGWANAELVSPSGVTSLRDLKANLELQTRPLKMVERRALPAEGQKPKYETIYHDYPESIVASLPSAIVYDIAGKGYARFRAVVGVDESSLRSDISPRIRFFVFAAEPDRRQLVRVEGDPPVPAPKNESTTEGLITRLYRHALARDPLPEERKIAEDFLHAAEAPGNAVDIATEGLEDLLWCLFMAPEFQYIQ